MPITIGSNIASLTAQRRLSSSASDLSGTFQRLSFGQRINRASDDAAGLAISQDLNARAKVYSQAVRNINDGVSVLSIADALALLESGQVLTMPLSRSLSGIQPGLHELRFRDKAGQVRVVYFMKRGDAIYLVHALRKKTQTLPMHEIRLILKRLKEI